MKYIKQLLILLIFSSCNQEKSMEQVENFETVVTDDQIIRYEDCKKNFENFLAEMKSRDYSSRIPDSTIKLYQDVLKLDLKEIVEKHKLKPYQIESFLRSICRSKEISNAFDKLDQKLEESTKLIQNMEDSLMEEFDFSKIEPLDTKVKIPESIKKNGGKYKYVDENGDTIIVNVKVAKYDE